MKLTTFLAIYRGKSIAEARLIAVTCDPDLVAQVTGTLLEKQPQFADPVVQTLEAGRRSALRLIVDEASTDDTEAE